MTTSKMQQQFLAARRAGTPLIAIKSFDPEATMQGLKVLMEATWQPKTPFIFHNCIDGMQSRNKEGQEAIDKALNGSPIEQTVNAVNALAIATSFPFDQNADQPTNPVLFMLNAHAYLDHSYGERKEFIQALWNLRIPFRDSLRAIVLLAPDFNFPAELQHDILILDEPLPTEKELTSIIVDTTEAAGMKVKETQTEQAVAALRGLVAFEAEQAVAMCISRNGKGTLEFDTQELWQRKKQMISSTKGLTVWVGGQKFDGLGGLDEVKRRFKRKIAGKGKPRVIVWIDEIEKAMAGSGGGDLSGTSSDQLGVILSEMQDKEYSGVLFVGVPGAAKSAFAKAIASEADCITIKLDLGGAKGEGLVGQAESEIRNAFKIIEAVGGFGGALFVATSNDIRVVRPELKRRMTLGIWYFDLPTDEEKKVIVSIYAAKYPDVDVKDWKKVPSEGWTGAEIENCFRTASEENVSLVEAARGIVPVAISGKDDIIRLRQEAAGRYSSVSYPGVYQMPTSQPGQQQPSQGRKMAV